MCVGRGGGGELGLCVLERKGEGSCVCLYDKSLKPAEGVCRPQLIHKQNCVCVLSVCGC